MNEPIPSLVEQPARRLATRTQTEAIAAPGDQIEVTSADQRTRSAGSQIKFRRRHILHGLPQRADVRFVGLELKPASPHLVPILFHRPGGLAARSWRRMGIEARIDLMEGCFRQARPILILSQQ